MTRWTPTEREKNIIDLKRKVNAELAAAKAEEQRRAAKAEADDLYREFVTDGGVQESLDLAERLRKSREMSELRTEVRDAAVDPDAE